MRQLRLLMTFAMSGVMFFMMSDISAADVMMYTSTTHPTFDSSERPVTLLNGDSGISVHGTITGPNAGVLFSTTNDILFNGDVNGTAAVRAVDGSINNLTISVPGATFTDAILDIYGVYLVHPTMIVTVYLSDGNVAQSFELMAGQTSRNWLTVQAFNNETISSIVISDAKFFAAEDTHISGAESVETPVPEPASIALVFSGLLGAGAKLRKYRRDSRKGTL